MKPLLTAPLSLWLWIGLGVGPALGQDPLAFHLQPKKLQLARRLLREGTSQRDSAKIAESYYVMGRAHYIAGDYLNARRWYQRSLRIQERRGDSYELGRLYIRFADIEGIFLHHPERMQQVRRAEAIFKRIGSRQGMQHVYSQLGDLYVHSWPKGRDEAGIPAQPDSALFFYLKKERLALELHDSVDLAYVKGIIGDFLVTTRNDPRGLTYQHESLALYRQQRDSLNQIYRLAGLAHAYLHLGQVHRAWPYLAQTSQLVETYHLNELVLRKGIETGLLLYYRDTGQWQQAFLHQEQARILEQKQTLADRQGALTRLSVEFETEKKEAQLKAQHKELLLRADNLRLQQRYGWVSSGLLLFTLGACGVFFWLFRKNKRLSAHNAGLVREQNHRVKNNLQAVSSLLHLQANQLADPAARRAVTESHLRVKAMAQLHQRLYDGEELAVVDATEFLTELVETVLTTFGYGHVEPAFELEPLSLSADVAVPLGLLLNELSTNACKYAFPDHAAPRLRVVFRRVKNKFHLLVADNGPGIGSLSTEGRSFGMRLIRLQAEQLRATYRFGSEGGTQFSMEFGG